MIFKDRRIIEEIREGGSPATWAKVQEILQELSDEGFNNSEIMYIGSKLIMAATRNPPVSTWGVNLKDLISRLGQPLDRK